MLKSITTLLSDVLSILKGMGVTWNNMLRKPVTLQYPLEKARVTDKARGLVDLRPEKCIICWQCVKVCPTAALDLKATLNLETKKKSIEYFRYNAELCCFCGLCAEICPADAIHMGKCYEVSCFKREDLSNIDLLNKDKYQAFQRPEPGKERT